MPLTPFNPVRPGELTRSAAAEINRLMRAVEELARIEGVPPVKVEPYGVRPRVSVEEPDRVAVVEITGAKSGCYYPGRRLEFDRATCAWVAAEDIWIVDAND